MKPYPEYKPSGIDWLGEIPSHWVVTSLKWIFDDIGSGTTPTSGADEFYRDGTVNWLQTGDLNDGIIKSTAKKITEYAVATKGLRVYPKGSMVIAMYGATIAKLGVLDIDTTVNQACCVISPCKKCDIKYAFYFFNAAKKELISLASGGGQPNISQAIISNFMLPVPPLDEQQAIAAYLDEETGKIEALMEEKRKQVEDLRAYRTSLISETVTRGLNPDAPLRSSDVDWLGEIPSHWDILSGKWCCEFLYGFPADSKLFTNEKIGMPLIRIRDIYSEDTEVYYQGNDYPEKSLIVQGDVLIGMDGDFNVAQWKGKEALLNQRVCKFESSKLLLKKYVFYFLPLALNKINAIKYSTTVKHLSATDLEEMKFSIPPLDEQQAIADFLDKKTAKIDALIDELTKQLDELAEYKKAVISEAVTGKVDVREWTTKKR